MRLFSILIALGVAAALYMLVFQRDDALEFAGAEPQAVEDAEPVAAAGPTRNAVSVVTLLSEAREIDSAVRLRGQTEADRQVDIRAETSGRIVSNPLRKGAFVKENEIMCQLDPGTREIQLSEATARLAEAKSRDPESRSRITEAEARLAEARIEQNAAVRLEQGGYASETRVASANAAVESALASIQAAKSGVEGMSAGIQAAEAMVAAAQTEIERLAIHAPFDGILETDTAELGELLQPGGLCATIIQLDPIKLVGFVPETTVDKITVGAPVGARLATGREIEGRVTFLSRVADMETRTFRVEVSLPNPDLGIREGQTAEIVIASAGRQAHLLPQSALTLNDEGDIGVRVVTEAQTALFKPVQIIRDTTEGVWLGGLDDVSEVIVVGQEFVTDGVAVAPSRREEITQ